MGFSNPTLNANITVTGGPGAHVQDAVVYVSSQGNDLNDGLSFGGGKLTLAAAVAALPATGGDIIIGGGGPFILPAPTARNVPNVHIRGIGKDVTVLQLDPNHWAAFQNGFLIQANGPALASGWSVEDLTIDGNHRAGGSGANQGGGIAVGNDWTLDGVKFFDTNYFPVWISGASGVTVRKCDWISTVGAADSIGGGNGPSDIVIERCFFSSDIGGSVMNLTAADNVTFRKNRVHRFGILMVGWINSRVVENDFRTTGAVAIAMKGQYAEAGQTFNQLPRNNVVADNYIEGDVTVQQGVTLVYTDSPLDAAHTRPGGGNIIRDNQVRGVQFCGILITGGSVAGEVVPKVIADKITGNTVENVLTASGTFATGFGTCDIAGIVDMYGDGDVIEANHVADDQAVPLTQFGVSLGATGVGAGLQRLANAVVKNNTSKGITGPTVTVRSTGTVLASCLIADNPGFNPQGPAAIAVGGSTFTYTNNDNVNEVVSIDGGTVSAITKGGVTMFTSTGKSVLLGPGEAVAVTYSVIPTMVKDRR